MHTRPDAAILIMRASPSSSASSLGAGKSSSMKKHSLRSSKNAFTDHRSLFPGIEEGADIRRQDHLNFNEGDRVSQGDRNIFLIIVFNILQIVSIIGGFLLIFIWAHFGIKYNLFFNWALILGIVAIITHLVGMASLFWRCRKMGLLYLLMVLGSVLLYAYIILHVSSYEGKFDRVYAEKWDSLSAQQKASVESEVRIGV
ncbi:hypothetical protein DI09_5p230 [Mitosporidium daphniae]|uniref:Uncharacterized protein n=1 Tax=Mitosporidium daphniae TaxID=1485682 RepID=A0A098VSF1_9MICR|nr:uncharacterized protein DI09_5p230 [Mitosporidium daphniae]KGG50676.1 hypothetical protein DI09_5p230 [Mitosporidium daphniae]|eukprot:XP_013237103.1 uncharacterized protein DI09_5p230 [Mitosporidium daphniae]